MIRTLVTAAMLAIAAPALAAENPVKVTADSFVVNENESAATFTGNVVVVRSDLTVWADEVDITYGEGGMQSVKQLTAKGRVRLKTSDQTATGERAVFTPSTQVLRLTGNVTVVNASGTLNGPELVMNLADRTTTFQGGKGGRVTGEFTPE